MRAIRISVLIASLFAPSGVNGQGTRATPVIVDHRESRVPSTRWAVAKTCTVYGAESTDFPDGLDGITGGTRLSDGTIVLSNAGTMQLYYFDAAGKLMARAGGRGGGPGEFGNRSVFMNRYRNDSIAAYEVLSPRISIYGPDAKFARTFTLQSADPATVGVGTPIGGGSPDGKLVTRFGRLGMTGAQRVERDSVTLLWFDVTGAQRVKAGPLENALSVHGRPEVASRSTAPPGGRASGFSYTVRTFVVGPVTRSSRAGGGTVAVGEKFVYHFEERTDALVQYDSDGIERRRILLRPVEARLRPNPDKIVTPPDVQGLALYADRLDRAWVEIPREKRDGERKWWVFDSEGRWLAEATTPAFAGGGIDPLLEVGPDYALWVKRGQDDVETVAYCKLDGIR